MMQINKVAEKWEIWDEKKEAKGLVPKWFHRQIKVFGKKVSKKIPMRKAQDYIIDLKEGFVPRKGNIYLLLREESEEVRKFITEQMRKGYIRLLSGVVHTRDESL